MECQINKLLPKKDIRSLESFLMNESGQPVNIPILRLHYKPRRGDGAIIQFPVKDSRHPHQRQGIR